LEDENIMNLVDLEDEILKSKVTDVEAAAGILQGQAKNATISFCSGLDTCPPQALALFAKDRTKPGDRKVYKRQC
jgi:hypothetical protein